ncbi:MAG: acyltransferase family protein [Maricaulaceae bacterium]
MTSQSTERLHALDAVRGGALLLGVVLHATMSFFPDPIWITADNDPSEAMTITFIVIHIFRMSLFFMIAGFFARMSFHRRGLKAFAADRAKRIALPFAVAWPFLLIAFIALAIWGAVHANGGEIPQEAPPQPPLTLRTFPLFHTWFLYMLLWLYAGALILRGAVAAIDQRGRLRAGGDRVVGMLVRSHLAPIVLGAPLAAVFFFRDSWVNWLGVHTPDYGLVPNLQAFVAFGTAFGFGWVLHRRIDLLNVWRRWWPLHLGLAIGLTIVCLAVLEFRLNATDPATDVQRLISAAAYPLAIWTWTFGLVGLAMQFLSGHSPMRRYVADASYWIYLVHLPLVMAAQIAVSQMALPWFVKFPAILAVVTAIALITYHLFVRFSFIGAVLNGRRFPKPGRAEPPTAAKTAAT